ncbi:MAG: hypothetical protein K8U57_14195 [Planctomycetes bacterium]|nr:hypothetical protein [Planctomycetota bacterium]
MPDVRDGVVVKVAAHLANLVVAQLSVLRPQESGPDRSPLVFLGTMDCVGIVRHDRVTVRGHFRLVHGVEPPDKAADGIQTRHFPGF